MNSPLSVLVPLLNPNEMESSLVKLAVSEGQRVTAGDLLAVFETTKSTFELDAEVDGYVRGIRFAEGNTCRAGDRLCYLAQSPGEALPVESEAVLPQPEPGDPLPGGLRITQPALELARQNELDLSQLPTGTLVTETAVRQLLASRNRQFGADEVMIYGGGGHAKSLIDLMRACGGVAIAGIVDDRLPAGSTVMGVPVLGGGSQLVSLHAQGLGRAVNAVGGIGDISPRLAVFQHLREAGFTFPTLIHPRGYVESSAKVADGCQVFFNAYVGSDAKVGFGCIVNTGAILSHDCELEDYVNISPGAILAGAVKVGEKTLIGMGVTINLGVQVGAGARIGNSAVIKADVPANTIIRAGSIWPPDGAGKQ